MIAIELVQPVVGSYPNESPFVLGNGMKLRPRDVLGREYTYAGHCLPRAKHEEEKGYEPKTIIHFIISSNHFKLSSKPRLRIQFRRFLTQLEL